MSSLSEVQRLIGLSLNKLSMGRQGRGGLSLHKNLLVATVLNKARDVYMQETMYMNYRLMACGQFSQEDQEEMEDEDTPDTEDYEEDSESDVEDDSDNSGGQELRSLPAKEYSKEYVGSVATATSPVVPPAAEVPVLVPNHTTDTGSSTTTKPPQPSPQSQPCTINSDEGFIDETDCDCDARNYHHSDGENRVPFQYCFNCAPFHPSNGRGPTLVSPGAQASTSCLLAHPATPAQEDKLIYDMDSKSTQNQPAAQGGKRKRQISSEETEDAVNSILPKKKRELDGGGGGLNDSGFAEEEEKVFHPAFRGAGPNGMEVDQITSLVSIFSFGQQLFAGGESQPSKQPQQSKKPKKDPKEQEEDSDSDSDTSSDSGHSSDDPDAEKKGEEGEEVLRGGAELLCSSMAKAEEGEVVGGQPVAAAV